MFSSTFDILPSKIFQANIKISKDILDKVPRTPDQISYFAKHLGNYIVKPQTIVKDHKDYYVAKDDLTNTWYMCLRQVMMIDIDLKFYDNSECALKELRDSDLLFELYKSHSGYHAFCVSQTFNYDDNNTHKIMFDLGCDYFYIVWASIRGWSVRLNFKKKELLERLKDSSLTEPLYTYLGLIGNLNAPINMKLKKLIKKHLNYSNRYINYPVIKSFIINSNN